MVFKFYSDSKFAIVIMFVAFCLLSLLSACEKGSSSDASNKLDNYLILESNTGVKDTLMLEGTGCCRNFDINVFKSARGYFMGKHVISFSIASTRALPTYVFDLYLAKSDSLIRVDQTYSNNNITRDPEVYLSQWDIFTLASYKSSQAEITFTSYKYPGRISGNFKTYYNGSTWYKGTFSFVQPN